MTTMAAGTHVVHVYGTSVEDLIQHAAEVVETSRSGFTAETGAEISSASHEMAELFHP